MSTTHSKPIAILLGVALACAACLALLAGCAAPEGQVDAAEKNREYMMRANNAMLELNKELDEFSAAAATGDVVTMEQRLKTASRMVESFKGIESTEATKGIHDEYCAGCDELREALADYVDLYRKAEGLETGTFNDRIAKIQEQYDAGIAHLEAADKMVTELPGATPQASESESAAEGQASSESASAAEAQDDSSSSSEESEG